MITNLSIYMYTVDSSLLHAWSKEESTVYIYMLRLVIMINFE